MRVGQIQEKKPEIFSGFFILEINYFLKYITILIYE
ncbi:hypothetical protein CWO_02595 [Buchnera aphidicola str. LL01 (Acyrthosiphon pisum)]|nr:hypothetical protein CWO_02595 [Buchnera aphidicola str. LL01 (Acyrthosiphon pisum)]ADP67954.1 hypothetical protein CWU_03220 [Buchnera aphidicola str. JF98 (Acyrthosiphon pisum)]